jgi:hypothetical protein
MIERRTRKKYFFAPRFDHYYQYAGVWPIRDHWTTVLEIISYYKSARSVLLGASYLANVVYTKFALFLITKFPFVYLVGLHSGSDPEAIASVLRLHSVPSYRTLELPAAVRRLGILAARKFWRQLPMDLSGRALYLAQIVGEAAISEEAQYGQLWDKMRDKNRHVAAAAWVAVNSVRRVPEWADIVAQEWPQAVTAEAKKRVERTWESAGGSDSHVMIETEWVFRPEFSSVYADVVVKRLTASDPACWANLRDALGLALGKSEYDLLARLAPERIRQYEPAEHGPWSNWLETWLIADAGAALDYLEGEFHLQTQVSMADVFQHIEAGLSDLNHPTTMGRDPSIFRMPHLARIASLCCRLDDSSETYWPTRHHSRDTLRNFRERLFQCIESMGGEEHLSALRLMRQDTELQAYSWLIDETIEGLCANIADRSISSHEGFLEYERIRLLPPETDEDLYRLALRHLRDCANEVETAVASLRRGVERDAEEAIVADFLISELNRRSNGYYTVVPDSRYENRNRPDLIFATGKLKFVPCEIKTRHRTNPQKLKLALREQLGAKYLVDARLRRGIFIVANTRPWQDKSKTRAYRELIADLEDTAAAFVEENRTMVDRIDVVSIDFYSSLKPGGPTGNERYPTATPEWAVS